jgi:hypothetical protein
MLGLAGLTIPAAMLIRERRQARGAEAQWPGDAQALAPRQGPASSMCGGKVRDTTTRRWSGVVYVPSAMGYVRATPPLGVLEVAPGRIGLRVRPTFVRATFGAETLDVTVGQDVVVFPARRSRPQGLEGIGIRVPRRQSFYFWNHDRSEVLAAAAAAGFEVSHQEQEMKLR